MEHTCADDYTVQFLHCADTIRSGVVSKTRAREAVSVQRVNQALRSHGNGTHDGRVAIGTWPGTRGSGCLASYDTQGYSSICSLSCICTLLACLQGTGSNPPRTVLMNDTNDSNSNQATEYICKRSIANMPSPSRSVCSHNVGTCSYATGIGSGRCCRSSVQHRSIHAACGRSSRYSPSYLCSRCFCRLEEAPG